MPTDEGKRLPTVSDLSLMSLAQGLRTGEIALQTGPLWMRIRSELPSLAPYLSSVYADYPVQRRAAFADFDVALATPSNLRRWFRPQAVFSVDGLEPFEPLPLEQAPAFLEWGMNWTIASSCHQWLMLHAACLERHGRAVLLPAPSGSGKSTLCAALALRGWRLLSDEMCLIEPDTLNLVALARPINLKNASIEVIRRFAPDARWGPTTYDTAKGLVTHLRAPAASVAAMDTPAAPAWIVFPRWAAGEDASLVPRSRRQTFIEVASNAFNYSSLGALGFSTMSRLVRSCSTFDFRYSRLDEAVEVFEWLAEEAPVPG